jgi:GTPase SAR1 family protein
MGCTSSALPGAEENAKINKSVRREEKKWREQYRLLLLGTGESGKSTIFKQMKILQVNGGFTAEELAYYKVILFKNVVGEMRTLVRYLLDHDFKLQPDNVEPCKWFAESVPSDGSVWTPEVGNVVTRLWADPAIQQVWALRGTHYHINDTADYFFNNVQTRYLQPDFIPTTDDVLRSRIRSTGIEEADFKFVDMQFKMIDVGGQRAERRKWIHCFQSAITAIVYCCSLNEYDQKLREDDKNRLEESLDLFEEITSSQYFKNPTVPIILLLTKLDLFTEKVTRVDLKICPKFVNYTSGCDFDKALEAIRSKFLFLAQNRTVYVHPTIAVDTKNVDVVFRSVRRSLLGDILDSINL